MRSKFTAQPVKSMEQAVRLTNPVAATLPRTFVNCTETRWFTAFVERAWAAGWRYRELDAVHDAMITAPEALVDLLLEAAT